MKILVFGAAREVIGKGEFEWIPIGNELTVGELKHALSLEYPGLKKLKSLSIAVNEEYASEERRLDRDDVIALIPPVSGG
ncbi:MAG: MoaD/ThiS family protein [Flavobacteriales bacterium]|nr:MoaD/ThiS family protein [Bacteroidota bacterium]MCB9240781.1 MoaD/ThiS family protein [Flavobacteriales bacterium]